MKYALYYTIRPDGYGEITHTAGPVEDDAVLVSNHMLVGDVAFIPDGKMVQVETGELIDRVPLPGEYEDNGEV